MTHKPKKYFFDNNDFDEEVMQARARALEEAKRRPSFSQEEMEAARQTGFAQGREDGMREAMLSLESQLAQLMTQITTALNNFNSAEAARTHLFVEQASIISSQILAKAVPTLQDYLALPQLQSFLSDILLKQVKKSNLIIHIPARYEDALNKKIAELAASSPHGESWQVKASPTLSAYQCKVEWDGGGAQWNPERVAQTALDAISAQIPEDLKNQLDRETPPDTIDEAPQNPHNEPDNPEPDTPLSKAGD